MSPINPNVKKYLLVALAAAIVFVAAIIIAYFTPAAPEGKIKCVNEGGMSSGEAPEIIPCCEGLTVISAINDDGQRTYDMAYCTRCGDGDCKSPENKYNCPKDCK